MNRESVEEEEDGSAVDRETSRQVQKKDTSKRELKG